MGRGKSELAKGTASEKREKDEKITNRN